MPSLDQYGFVEYSGTRALITDLTPPFYRGTEISAELLQTGAEIWGHPTNHTFLWKISCGSYQSISTLQPDEPFTFVVPDENADTITIEVDLLNNRQPTSISLSKTYDCHPEDNIIRQVWESDDTRNNNRNKAYKAYIEVLKDLYDYITAAANATGPNGISPRMLAAVLTIEISNRPKSKRASEIATVREEVVELAVERTEGSWFNANFFLHKSFGVGQTKMSTLAMALNMMPLIEHERVNGHHSREDDIEEQFMETISIDQMFLLWKKIRWPKSATLACAQILASLKNRPNRYPGLNRASFVNNQRAVAIIASEYNIGATNSSESSAGPSSYGNVVVELCEDINSSLAVFDHT